MRKLTLSACLLAAACAAPQTMRPTLDANAVAAQQQDLTRYALETRAAEYQRVYAIAERLRAANVDLCPDKEGAIGVMFENIYDFSRDTREAAQQLWGLTEQPQIIWVASGSPAEAAGVRIHDRLMGINGQAVRPGRHATQQAFQQLRRAARAGDVMLVLGRGTETASVRITPVQRCAYSVIVSDDTDINASADGETIVLNRGALNFARNDQELALILAHELGHDAMHHVQAMRQNQVVGAVGGAVFDVLAAAAGVNTGGAFSRAGGDIGARMFSQQFEEEADYVGMYFLVRAGYSTDGVEDFWRRMAVENPQGVRLSYSHPNFAQRFLQLAAVRQEIAAKQATGAPLTPNIQHSQPAVAQTLAAPTPNAVAPPASAAGNDGVAPAPAPVVPH